MKRLVVVLAVAAAWLGVATGIAAAHPLGNFTVNTSAGLTIATGGVRIDYVVDMAEIPAFQARQSIDADRDGSIADAEARTAAAALCAERSRELVVDIDGRRAENRVAGHHLSFPPGTGGLPTLRLECGIEASGSSGPGAVLRFEDRSYPGRLGWHEVTATGQDLTIRADVPATSPSRRLTGYPGDLLRSPLDVRRAEVRIGDAKGSTVTPERPGEPPAPAGSASTVDRLTRSFVALVSRQRLTTGFVLLAALAAVALGALHAAAPGHGKAMIAAAVVGSRARVRQAVALGASMAAAHTAGVVALGVAVAAFGVSSPERAYPWLTLAGGVVAGAVGAGLVRRWLRSRSGAAGSHRDHGHDRGHSHGRTRRDLLWLGVTGGLVPSPSALLVLLAALSLGRPVLGVTLVVCYGIGMAATMTALAVAFARAGRALDADGRSSRIARLAALSRPVGAFAVVAAGVLVAVRGAAAI